MTIRLVASDLDGTLLRPDHTLSPRTIEVLRAVRETGVKIVAATGRGPLSTWPVIEPARDSIDVALSSNGAVVLDTATNTVLQRFALDAGEVERLVDALRAKWPDVALAWETAAGLGYEAAFLERFPYLDEFSVVSQTGMALVPLNVHDEMTKLLISHPTIVRKDLMDAVSALAPNLVATSSGVDFVEVSGTGIDKSSGLRYVCDGWGIDSSEVLAFGDNWNDMAMLDWAGTGVAMGHAAEDVASAADLVIGSNADDAVAAYLADLLL